MSQYYIDETTGSDTTGDGTEQKPYQSLAYALFTHGQSSSCLIRKDSSAPYDEPTQSALKKAKKGADGLEKKKKKAEEIAEREAREKGEADAKREKLLEESKKIKLEEDPSLPAAVKVYFVSFYGFILFLFVADRLLVKTCPSRWPQIKAGSCLWLGPSSP
jgi:asparaginyl-tRNA synthetase